MRKNLGVLISTTVFRKAKSWFWVWFVFGGLIFGIDGAVGQKPASEIGRFPRHPLSLDGSNFLKQTYLSRTDVPYKAIRRFYYSNKTGLGFYDEVVQVSFSKSNKKSRLFFQKTLANSFPERLRRNNGFKFQAYDSFNEGFNYKYRDFRVVDPILAKKNYYVIPMGKTLTLNRKCALFFLKPKNGNHGSFLVVGDLKTAIIVSYYCFNSEGSLNYALVSSELHFGNFEKNPKQKWWKQKYQKRKYLNLNSAFGKLGFKVSKYPKPTHGFVLQEITTLYDSLNDKSWVNLFYSDGILSRFLLIGKEDGGVDSFVEGENVIFKEIKRGNYYQISSSLNGLSLVFIGQNSFQNLPPKLILSIY